MQDLLAWCASGSRHRAFAWSHPLLGMISPADLRRDCIAAPLHADEGPRRRGDVAFVAALVQTRDRVLLSRTFASRLASRSANTARVHELKRLREALEADKQALLTKLGRHDVADAVVGTETGLRAVMEQVEQVAATDVPVLIFGETGSGKEVLARALHERSRRARAPIVRVNCGAIPPGLVDSELFGHERGSFTGAWPRARAGSSAPMGAPCSSTRSASCRSTRRCACCVSCRTARSSVSVDSARCPPTSASSRATHRDLRTWWRAALPRRLCGIASASFRSSLPPLRERREDIPRLAAHFAARAATRLVGSPLMPTLEDLDLLLAYDWPGNVRELAAVIERAAILGAGRTLRIAAALGPATPPLAVATTGDGSDRF